MIAQWKRSNGWGKIACDPNNQTKQLFADVVFLSPPIYIMQQATANISLTQA